ncbi:MarR family winged helix-turn-helix transcriptional regulator (plasmid) [Streptomyces sp. BI20]|uniref:MarR family winged helix-turn-helix transcriptional regulator n=1 Tax=Streptomyces sp. BI20 TaxID=3403460 RepID=UPI003C75F37B
MENDATARPSGAGAGIGPGDEDGDLGAPLRLAVGRLHRRFRAERPEGALGDVTLDVLVHLHKHGPRTLTELSREGGVSPASMSQTVNRLSAAGYVVRTRDPHDGRKVLFEATPEGRGLAQETREHRNAWLDARLAGLDEEERATIARATRLLLRLADG